jgi:tetratricopeptide (TPR) repeat protein
MAITPRTIFSNPASATVAAVALLAFSAVGTLAYQVADRAASQAPQIRTVESSGPCNSIREVIGQDRSSWSQTDWIVYASCFENRNNSRAAARVAEHGIRFYPASEALYNIAGYHQIKLGEYSRAVHTLRTGLHSVGNPTNGVMANNLAWAGLWVPREMKPQQARELYQSALRYDRNSCETLHTGLWVEFAVAKQTKGLEEYQALKNFQKLRQRYESCQQRVQDGKWKTMVEVVGATVLFQEVDRSLRAPHTVSTHGPQYDGTRDLLRVSQELRQHYRGSSIDALCSQAMPLASTHHLCVDSVNDAMETLRDRESSASADDRRKTATGCIFQRAHR